MSLKRCGLLGVLLLMGACEGDRTTEGAAPETVDRCPEVIAQMAACFPDLANEAVCTDDTVAQFDRLGDRAGDCDAVGELGKADWFAGFDGCPADQHVCGYLFCCDAYEITWRPSSDTDWDIVPVVQVFQAAAPAEALAKIEAASRDDLLRGLQVTFVQSVAEYTARAPVEMAVEISVGLVELPYEVFARQLPAEAWGVNLSGLIGGEVDVYERDEQGRAILQLERMVLSPWFIDIETPLSNNDMTKVEAIHYRDDQAVVYWRVMFSNNDSTETDVGSVSFARYDEGSTLITFHSAHRLNAPAGVHIPNHLVTVALGPTFGAFIDGYRELLGARGR